MAVTDYGTWEVPLAIATMIVVIPALLLFLGNRDLYPIRQREPKWAAISNFAFQVTIWQYLFEKEHPELPVWWNIVHTLVGWGIMLCLYCVRTWKLYIDAGLAHERVQNKFGWFVQHRHYRSPRFLAKFITILALIQVGILCLQLLITTNLTAPARNANRGYWGSIVFALVVLSYFFTFAVFGCKLRGLRDGFFIKSELSGVGTGGILCVLLWLVYAILNGPCAFPSCSVLILWVAASWMFFWSILRPLSIAARDPHFALIKAVKPIRPRHTITSESSKISSKNEHAGLAHDEVSDYRESIVDIKPEELPPPPEGAPLSAEKLTKLRHVPLTKFLTYPPGRDAFRAFTVLEFSVENLLFVEAVKELHSKPHTVADVRELFQRFIAESAPNQVNLPSIVLQRVKARVQEEDFDVKDLEEAVSHIFKVMQRDTFKRFQKTAEWETYVRVFDADEKHKRGKSAEVGKSAEAQKVAPAATPAATADPASPSQESVAPNESAPGDQSTPAPADKRSQDSVLDAPASPSSPSSAEAEPATPITPPAEADA